MITRSADEISKMEMIDFLKEHIPSAMFLHSCSAAAAVMGVGGETATIGYAMGVGTSLAANDVINATDMTGFDAYMEKIIAIARIAYIASYHEIKGYHEAAQKQEGKQTGRPS